MAEERLITGRGMSMVVSAIGGKSWGSRAFTVVKGGLVNGVKGLGGEGRRKSIGGWGVRRVEVEIEGFSGVSEAGLTSGRVAAIMGRATGTPDRQILPKN